MLPTEDYEMTQEQKGTHSNPTASTLLSTHRAAQEKSTNSTRRGRWAFSCFSPECPLCHFLPPKGKLVGPETKATLWKPQPAQQLLQAAAAVACLNSFTTGLDDVGSSFSLWPSISHGWGKDSLSTVFSFSSSQQNLSAADAWLGGCALARALLPFQHTTKATICHGLERRRELKTRQEEPVTSVCCARTRGFATQHSETRSANLQMRQYIATRWSHNSPQQHTGISPHHQSYPGSE